MEKIAELNDVTLVRSGMDPDYYLVHGYHWVRVDEHQLREFADQIEMHKAGEGADPYS